MDKTKYSEIFSIVEKIKNGTCVRIGYKVDVPVYKKFDNITIKKIVVLTGRLGVKYKNIKTVKERVAANSAKSAINKNNYEWIIENKIKYNKNTDKYYLSVATFSKGSNKKVCYEICNNGKIDYIFSKKELKKSKYSEMICSSYFNDKDTEIFSVSLDSVFRINDVNV